MEQKTDRLYPSAPLENIVSEQRLEKNINDVNSFNNSFFNIKETILYFKDKNHKSKKKYKKCEAITTVLKAIDTIVIIATTASSSTLSLKRINLIVIPISTASACALSIGIKVVYEIVMQSYNKYKKECEKDKENFKSFDTLYRKSLQDNLIDENENKYKSLSKIFTRYLDESKVNLFYKYEHKNKIIIF